ncbi:hypothetical protein TVAG_495900 [Trichomonas vaginalis G3]|uniref:Uncharacterized protein n=1 Tax=Trichomonas vaginalis (strain ATCC PRA-98 / G3) TaxID=412133 RepID=A2DVM9_TRIV3|nr:hypothetical protein TVAGG3_0276040 [Trichomonas vaginalis G3]EAY15571.1 hypothetical protein TVAG_495900 [Trichomonas vaginalis G3]KAI5526217.1 hypothetical protein TVAGG3_0276040 [Trichomonas vaginalis G3]|eukprot:XP_001327794.1 hypothetical protein [Trichomonas vaginalis G3]
MHSSTNSSTNSLIEYAKNLDTTTSKIYNSAGKQLQEYEIIDLIQEKGIRDHHEKSALRTRIRSAEERIQTLEDLLSKKSTCSQPNLNKIVQTTNNKAPHSKNITARALIGCSCSEDSSSDSSMNSSSDNNILIVHSHQSISSNTNDSSLFNSKLSQKHKSKPTKVIIVDSKEKKEKQRSDTPIIVVNTVKDNFKSNKNATRIKTNYIDSEISDTSSPAPIPVFTDSNTKKSKISDSKSTKTATSDLIRPSGIVTNSVSTSSLLKSSEVSDKSKSKISHKTHKSSKSKERQKEIDRREEQRVREYLKKHQEKKRLEQQEYLEGWHGHRVYQVQDEEIEKYATVHPNELDCICGTIRKDNCRCHKMREIEDENCRLRMNLRKIKREVQRYKDHKELKEIDDLFRNVNEDELLGHIAVEFHDFLGANEDISRDTAYKLVSRAAKAINH